MESQVEKLAKQNDKNIQMTKFSNPNVHFPPQKIISSINVETYNINTEYVITPHIGMLSQPQPWACDQGKACKSAGKCEAWESHFMLSGVWESVRE